MDTLNAADVARLLGVTRERVRQMAASGWQGFPRPIITEPSKGWNRDEVEA